MENTNLLRNYLLQCPSHSALLRKEMEKLENKLEYSADKFVERLLENYPFTSRRVQIELKNLKRKK